MSDIEHDAALDCEEAAEEISRLQQLTEKQSEQIKTLEKYKPTDEYRLSDADLERIINDAGAANDLAWAVKDLLSAHYEIAFLKESFSGVKAEFESHLESAQQEITTLSERSFDFSKAKGQLAIANRKQKQELEKLRRQVVDVIRTMIGFMDHRSGCTSYTNGPCICGLLDALKVAADTVEQNQSR